MTPRHGTGRPADGTRPETTDLVWFADWAETVEFRTATTVPEAPHAYRQAGGDPDYDRVRDTIEDHGTPRDWPRPGSQLDGTVSPRTYRYLRIGDLEYWVGPPGFVNRGVAGRLD